MCEASTKDVIEFICSLTSVKTLSQKASDLKKGKQRLVSEEASLSPGSSLVPCCPLLRYGLSGNHDVYGNLL